MRTNHSASAHIVLRDAAAGHWLAFTRPRQFFQARTLAEVAPALAHVEEAVAQEGLYAAGFVSYEAAPAFDNSLILDQFTPAPAMVLSPVQFIPALEST